MKIRKNYQICRLHTEPNEVSGKTPLDSGSCWIRPLDHTW